MQIGQIGQILLFYEFLKALLSLYESFRVTRYIDNIFEIFAKALVVSSSPLLGGSIK